MNAPYELVDGKPLMRDSVVLFLDILGSQDWSTGPKAQPYLNRLYSALDKSRGFLESADSADFVSLWFTDNIVVGCPLDDQEDVEASLGLVCFLSAIFQSVVATDAIFVRGGISRGLVYMDQHMAFGPALVESYRLERDAAIYPRIVLSEELASQAKSHSASYLNAAALPDDKRNKDFLVASDDRMFLNYLVVLPSISDEPAGKLFDAHKKAIENCLHEFADKPSVWAKYCWLADYHDFIVTQANRPELCITSADRSASFDVYYSSGV